MRIEIQNKEDAGKRIPEIKNLMISVASEIPKLGGIILINCMLEALRGLQVKASHEKTINHMLKQISTKDDFEGTIVLEPTAMIRNFLEQWYTALEAAIMYVQKYGKVDHKKIKPVFVGTIWAFGRTYAVPKNFFYPDRDVMYRRFCPFFNRCPITYAFIFQDVKNSENEKTIEKLLRFRELYQILNILQTTLRVDWKYSIDFSNDEITYRLDSNQEDVTNAYWADPSISPRRLFYSLGPHDWDHELEISINKQEQCKKLGQIQTSLDDFYKKLHAVYQSYVDLPRFSKAFQRYFSFSLNDFYKFIKAVIKIPFNNKIKVECIQTHRLEVILSKITGMSRNKIKSQLNKLLYRGDTFPPYFPLVSVGKNDTVIGRPSVLAVMSLVGKRKQK